MNPKLIAMVFAAATTLAGSLYGAWVFLDDLLVTSGEANIRNLQVLIKLDENRIATYTMHKSELTEEKRAELDGLIETVKGNRCEFNKAIGVYKSDHGC
jgi:hypothetical protein